MAPHHMVRRGSLLDNLLIGLAVLAATFVLLWMCSGSFFEH